VRRIAELSSDAPAAREEASNALRRMGFGAEPELWRALDASSEETRSRAAALLLEAYGAQAPPEPVPAGWEKRLTVTVDCSDTRLQNVIADILRQANGTLALIWGGYVDILEERVTFRVSNMSPEMALRMLLYPRNINCVFGSGCALLASPGITSLPAPTPRVVWLKPALARKLETLIADLASADDKWPEKVRGRFRELEEMPGLDAPTAVLNALASAAGTLEGAALQRCQRLRRAIAASHQIWYEDLPSGADLQALTPAQKAILEAKVVIPAPRIMTLEEIFREGGVRVDFREPVRTAYALQGKEPTRASMLRIVLRPRGLDFYLDGETIVIDSAERVQAAVEK